MGSVTPNAMHRKPALTRREMIFPALLLTIANAHAHSYKHGAIQIGHAWALPTTLLDGQLLMPLLNTGTSEDALVAARTPVAQHVELRKNARYDDPAADRFILPPRKPLAMRPQAIHLRLMGLNKPLVIGSRFSVVLDFEMAGEVEVEAHVENAPGD
jgi:periplasmic copper chaperone A